MAYVADEQRFVATTAQLERRGGAEGLKITARPAVATTSARLNTTPTSGLRCALELVEQRLRWISGSLLYLGEADAVPSAAEPRLGRKSSARLPMQALRRFTASATPLCHRDARRRVAA
jgi:hypothetical protein